MKVTRSFCAGFFVQHVALALAVNLSKSVSPNKAFEIARYTHRDGIRPASQPNVRKTMRIVLILLSSFIAGCSFIDRVGNKPYIFPTKDEPYSEIIVNFASDSWFSIYNMDINGCFAGSSVVGSSGETVRIHSDKNVFMALERRSGGSFCKVIFSFTPEQNSKYSFTQGIHIKDKDGISGLFSGPDVYCSVSGQKILPSGKQEQIKLKQMKLHPSGLACLRMRELTPPK